MSSTTYNIIKNVFVLILGLKGQLALHSASGIKLDSINVSEGLEEYWLSLAVSVTPNKSHIVVSSVVNGYPHLTLIKIVTIKSSDYSQSTHLDVGMQIHQQFKISLQLVHRYSFKYQDMTPSISSSFPTMCTQYMVQKIPILTFFTCGAKKKMFAFSIYDDKFVLIKTMNIGSVGFGHFLTGSNSVTGEQNVVSIGEWVNLMILKYTL